MAMMKRTFAMLGQKIKAAGTKGALHREMGIPQGQKIPTDRLISQRNALRKLKTRTPEQTRRLRQINEALTFRGAN